MLDIIFIVGVVGLSLIAIAAVGFGLWNFVPGAKEYFLGVYYRFTGKEPPSDDEVTDENRLSQFDIVSTMDGGTVNIIGDDGIKSGDIEAVILLQPLFQHTGSSKWESKPEQKSLLIKTNLFWVANIPEHEGSPGKWLIMEEVPHRYGNLREFYLSGEDGRGGPARKFRNKNQVSAEPYRFPIQWKLFEQPFDVVDIGAFKSLSVKGNSDRKFYNGDFFVSVTSKDESGLTLFFLDPRRVVEDGYATEGCGVFLQGKEVDIKTLEFTPY